LKVSWEGVADYYTAAKLDEIFKQFGKVEDIVIKTRKSKSKGSAIVVMASKEAAVSLVSPSFVLEIFTTLIRSGRIIDFELPHDNDLVLVHIGVRRGSLLKMIDLELAQGQ
jgi:hypothetical protein